MGILDKLRPQAKWKHGDPSVRLEAVQALGDGDTDVLVQVATEDHDPRVRRAAVARIADADTLAAVTRNDSDPATRDVAVQRLVALAADAGAGAAGHRRAGRAGAATRARHAGAVERARGQPPRRRGAGVARPRPWAVSPGMRPTPARGCWRSSGWATRRTRGGRRQRRTRRCRRGGARSARRAVGRAPRRDRAARQDQAAAKRAKTLLAALTAPVVDARRRRPWNTGTPIRRPLARCARRWRPCPAAPTWPRYATATPPPAWPGWNCWPTPKWSRPSWPSSRPCRTACGRCWPPMKRRAPRRRAGRRRCGRSRPSGCACASKSRRSAPRPCPTA